MTFSTQNTELMQLIEAAKNHELRNFCFASETGGKIMERLYLFFFGRGHATNNKIANSD